MPLRGIIAVAALSELCRYRHNSLAQSHAFHLARTLMVPVTLFRSAGEYGVLPSEELDDADVDVIHEIDPFDFGPAH